MAENSNGSMIFQMCLGEGVPKILYNFFEGVLKFFRIKSKNSKKLNGKLAELDSGLSDKL